MGGGKETGENGEGGAREGWSDLRMCLKVIRSGGLFHGNLAVGLVDAFFPNSKLPGFRTVALVIIQVLLCPCV